MRALVLSGGGAKGAFQIGALQHLIINLERKYQIYCGVSVGAINSSYLSMYRESRSTIGIWNLKEKWLKLSTSKIYKRWCPFGKLHALWKPSVYNSAPLMDFIRSGLDTDKIKESGNKLRIGAASLTTGEYKIFDETYHDIAGAVLASASFPVMLSPVKLDGQLCTDGGIRDITPLKSAIDAGADSVDVIVTSPNTVVQKFSKDPNAIDLGLRCLDVMTDEIIDNDIKIAQLINELVSCGKSDKKLIEINIIRPSIHLGDSLDFEQENIRPMMKQGYEDAVKATSNLVY